jgi:histone chaperone ASF1
VNNEYNDEELRENPPSVPQLDKIVRNILAEKPRVTRFPCEFDAVSIPTEDGGNMQMMQEEITTEGFGNENVGFENGNAGMAAFAGGYADDQQATGSYEPSQTQFQQGECGTDMQQQQQQSQPLW